MYDVCEQNACQLIMSERQEVVRRISVVRFGMLHCRVLTIYVPQQCELQDCRWSFHVLHIEIVSESTGSSATFIMNHRYENRENKMKERKRTKEKIIKR